MSDAGFALGMAAAGDAQRDKQGQELAALRTELAELKGRLTKAEDCLSDAADRFATVVHQRATAEAEQERLRLYLHDVETTDAGMAVQQRFEAEQQRDALHQQRNDAEAQRDKLVRDVEALTIERNAATSERDTVKAEQERAYVAEQCQICDEPYATMDPAEDLCPECRLEAAQDAWKADYVEPLEREVDRLRRTASKVCVVYSDSSCAMRAGVWG
ncbi:unnamed protein product, partial [marine sediment metagenome]